MTNIFRPHSEKQDLAIFSKKRIVANFTGIQWGKTRVGAVRTKLFMHQFTHAEDSFLVLAPTYKIMKQATLPAFLNVMKGVGYYHKADATFEMNGGGIAYMRTNTDPDSIVGITNVRHIWGDEAGKYSLYFWENIQGRSAFLRCPITLTSSPYALNWAYKEIIHPSMKGMLDPDIELIQARSDENPYFPKDEYEKRKEKMDARRFNMMFGGRFDKMEGLVYDIFDEDYHIIPFDPILLPQGTVYVAGVDWGYNNQQVLLVRAITPDNYHYQVAEFYKTKLTIKDFIKVAQMYSSQYPISMHFCDPSRPENIEEFNRAGLPAMPADNSIRKGIDIHYDLIKEGRFKIFRGAHSYSLDEYEAYHYPDEDEDINVNKDQKEKLPVKANDHGMDATRYISVHTYKGWKKAGIIKPGNKNIVAKSPQAMIEILKRTNKNYIREKYS